MPCSDITETMRLRLGPEDRLAGYQLIKRTCGRAVGEKSLMEEAFAGMLAGEILAITADDFADAHAVPDETEMFLQLKHLFAVQSGLRALLGIEAAGPDDAVSVGRVMFEGDEVVLECDLAIDVITEKIKACGRCNGCAALSKRK